MIGGTFVVAFLILCLSFDLEDKVILNDECLVRLQLWELGDICQGGTWLYK